MPAPPHHEVLTNRKTARRRRTSIAALVSAAGFTLAATAHADNDETVTLEVTR